MLVQSRYGANSSDTWSARVAGLHNRARVGQCVLEKRMNVLHLVLGFSDAKLSTRFVNVVDIRVRALGEQQMLATIRCFVQLEQVETNVAFAWRIHSLQASSVTVRFFMLHAPTCLSSLCANSNTFLRSALLTETAEPHSNLQRITQSLLSPNNWSWRQALDAHHCRRPRDVYF
jgi:hypothetical protein